MLTCLLCGQDTPCFAQSSAVHLSGVWREAVILPFGSWRLNYELLASVACPRDSSLSPIYFNPFVHKTPFQNVMF